MEITTTNQLYTLMGFLICFISGSVITYLTTSYYLLRDKEEIRKEIIKAQIDAFEMGKKAMFDEINETIRKFDIEYEKLQENEQETQKENI